LARVLERLGLGYPEPAARKKSDANNGRNAKSVVLTNEGLRI
jgi:hypothetical protein